MTKQLRYLCTLLLCIIASVGWAEDMSETLSFGFQQMGTDGWGTAYEKHVVTFTNASVTFSSANKQSAGSTITDCPVTKGQPVMLVINDKTRKQLKQIKFTCKQWGNKTQTITLHYSTDGGSIYTSTNTTSSNFIISNDALPEGTNAVKITFSSQSNQVGIASAEIVISDKPGSSLSPAGLSFGENTSYTVNLDETFTAPSLTNPNNLPVSYASSETGVATVNATTGEVTLVGAGETTITASSEETTIYEEGFASYTLKVIDPNGPGTENNPYSVSEALANTPASGNSDNVYVKGIVSKFLNNDIVSDGINYRYYISDDGTTNNQLLVFKGKKSSTEAFNNAEDLQIGDVVVIYGKLTKYNSTKEIAEGNYIVSLTRREVPTLTFSENQYSVVKNGNLAITATSNSTGTITYASSNTDVAEIDATTGAITAKTAGTTTITATIAATDEYKSATATVELTVSALKHKVTFYQNGTILSEEEVTEDADITFPEATAEILGKSFIGWVAAEIEGETNDKPSLVSSATMGENDLTYYAVYANVEGEEFTATLTEAEIKANFSNIIRKYADATKPSYEDDEIVWSASCNVDAAGRPWFQIKKENDAYFKIASDLNISEIKLTITSAQNSSGGVTDITKHTAFSGTVYLESEASGSPEGTLGSSDEISNNSVTLVPNSSVNEIYIQTSAAARIWGAEVTCGNATYSGYCTTVKEQATIRLYLPNNPEGNLTEHQLSCSSAVILNVDTNSPGAITIQDMTDGITVIPNTENKTVTLLASTNNGKVFSQPGEYTFRVVVGETDSYTSASVDFKLNVVKFRAYFNNLTGFEETKDLANGTNGGQLKDQLISNTQWGDASYKTWTSTNEDVATIDNDGNITLISTGQVRFTHSYTGNDYNEPCKISTGVMTVIDTTPTVLPAAPTIFHDEGTYEGAIDVAIAGEGTIMYKLGDGEAQAYTAPIAINATTTVTAWTEQDGAKSDEVSKTFTINKTEKPAINLNGYYSIKNNGNELFVNVAGRKTVTFVNEDASKAAAGSVIKVNVENGQVKELRSQGVDIPGYAKRAMNYVPELVKAVVERLGENDVIGEQGLNLIADEFVAKFDYNLYLEEANGGYRIYGKTPSMSLVVDFYAKNKEIIDSRLPYVEGFVEEILLKVAERLHHPDSDWAKKFKVHDIWALIVNEENKLTEPVDEASTAKFYTEVLSSEANIWNFAHETAMIYWDKVESIIEDHAGELGDYSKYLTRVKNVQPNSKYYIVADGSSLDFNNEANENIKNNVSSTIWTLEERSTFDVKFNPALSKNDGKELYTTLYTDFAYTLPEKVKALKVIDIDETTDVAETEEITGVIPAQTPVLLMSTDTENLTKSLTLSSEAGTAVTGNLLVGADYLINKYKINSTQAEGVLNMLKSLSESLYNDYEYLLRKNAGTVNNKYFFGLDDADMELCVYGEDQDCVVRNLGTGENQPLAFYGDWQAPKVNQAFLVSETNPILLTQKGDVDRDGDVDYDDVKALVKIVLGEVTEKNNPDNYDFDAAKVNEDTEINIADVTALVNILLP